MTLPSVTHLLIHNWLYCLSTLLNKHNKGLWKISSPLESPGIACLLSSPTLCTFKSHHLSEVFFNIPGTEHLLRARNCPGCLTWRLILCLSLQPDVGVGIPHSLQKWTLAPGYTGGNMMDPRFETRSLCPDAHAMPWTALLYGPGCP